MPALPKVLEEPLLRLGTQLCSGTGPEQALDALDVSVRLVRDALRKRIVPPFGSILRWDLPRAVSWPFCFFSLYISAALWQTVGG